jgi:hypothetical protein
MFIHLTTSSDGDYSSNFRCLWKEYDHMIFVHHIFCNVSAVWCPFWFKVPQYVGHLNERLVFIWLEIIKECLSYLHSLSKEALALVSFPCMVRKDQWLSCCLFSLCLGKTQDLYMLRPSSKSLIALSHVSGSSGAVLSSNTSAASQRGSSS